MSGAPRATAGPPAPVIDDLAAFFTLTNRIATRLQQIAASPQSKLTLTEWLMLRAVRGAGMPTMFEVARKVGIGHARVSEQAEALSAAGFVVLSRGEVGKARQLSLSTRGEDVLGAFDARLQEAVSMPGSLATPISNVRRGAARFAKELASANPVRSGGSADPAIS